MGLEKKEGYQPTEEEIGIAEDIMTSEQKQQSKNREDVFDMGGNEEDYIRWPRTSLQILKNGEIKLTEGSGPSGGKQTILTPEGALLKLDEAQAYCYKAVAEAENKVRVAERNLEYAKAYVDKIGYMKDKVSGIKDEK